MSFTVGEFQDLIRILEQHPEWRKDLRRLVLTEELLTLPDLVRELTEAQQRTEQRVQALAEAQQRTEERLLRLESIVQGLIEAQQRTEQRVQALAEAQQRMEERLLRLESIVQGLIEAQQRTETQIRELTEAQKQTQEEIRSLTKTVELLAWRMERLTDEVGGLKEEALERRYRDHALAYFGSPTFRRVRALSPHELAQLLEEAIERGELTWEERQDILQTDLVVRGRLPDQEEAYLVVEVSWGVGISDVERAVRRAGQLEKAVKRTFPAVAGKVIIPEAQALAKQLQVIQVTDGQVTWPESFSQSK